LRLGEAEQSVKNPERAITMRTNFAHFAIVSSRFVL
jgi:hypothetical protein